MTPIAENDDNIDKSAWLGNEPVLATYRTRGKAITARQDVIVTESAEDRGGIEYRVLCRKTVFSWLYEADHLSAEQFTAGCDYQSWRDYFAAQWSGSRVQALDVAQLVSDGVTAHLFCLLLQRLHRSDQQLIDFALDTHAGEHTRLFVKRSLATYHATFERLYGLVDRLKSTLAACKRAYPEADAGTLAKELTRVFLGLK